MASTRPSRVCLKELSYVPVSASKAAMRPAATSPVPRAAPGGRTLVNSPPANTLPLLTANAHTAAFVCHCELGRALSVADCVVSGAGPGSGAVGEMAAQAGRA